MNNYFTPENKIFYAFYKNCKINSNEIANIKIDTIIEKSKELNKLYNCDLFKPIRAQRYIKIMEIIHTNYSGNITTKNKFSTTSILEKLLLLIFSVDPEFKAFIIYNSENTKEEIKKQMEYKFGIYDKNLIKIEKFFIQTFFNKEQKNSIQEEIEKRTSK